jgi:type VI secretion system protein ImpM
MTTAPDAVSPDTPGWYGKLSSLGDFATRRLPEDFRAACDPWLSHAMAGSRAQLGERWLDVYLTAPVLRFAWAPGVFDTRWWFGVMMPSCDNVGRYFPLLVAHPRARPPVDRIALDHLDLWLDHLGAAALQTLHEPATLDSFEAALADAPPWPTPGATVRIAMNAGVGGDRYELDRAATLNQWLHAISIHELQTRFAGHSLWWRQTEATQRASVNAVRGLPDPASFAALLSGT